MSFDLPQSRPKAMQAIIGLAAAGALLSTALFIVALVALRTDAQAQAEESAANLALTISREVARTIQSFDLSIQGTLAALSQPDLPKVSRAAQQLMLFDRAAIASPLQSITVFDETGRVVRDSRALVFPGANLSDRQYFWIHRDRPDAGLFVGDLHRSRFSGLEVLTMSRRMTKPDGSFGGVVSGAIGVEAFTSLLTTLRLGANGSATLALADESVLASVPADHAPGSLAGLFDHFRRAPSGRYDGYAEDGLEKSFTYAQIGNLPLVVCIGVAASDTTLRWLPRALTLALLMTLLALLVVALAVLLARELAARRAVEQKLVVAALVDPLTGVANRRAFEAQLSAAWLEREASKTPLSLLMIDLDAFKQYNDTFGHGQGDAALQSVAAVMTRCCRSGDLVARYGGEEFAVLLPHATMEAAFEIAERIRLASAALTIGSPDLDRKVTVSIGAAEASRETTSSSALLAKADAALYAAKAAGRNRTVMSATDAAGVESRSEARADAFRQIESRPRPERSSLGAKA